MSDYPNQYVGRAFPDATLTCFADKEAKKDAILRAYWDAEMEDPELFRGYDD